MMSFLTFLTEADKVSNKWVNIESVFKTPQELRNHLKKNILWIKFLKVYSDPGSIRIGRFTLDMNRIPSEDKPKGLRHGPDYQIRMYEVFPGKKKGQWRSCLFSNVLAVRNAQETPFKDKPEVEPTKPDATKKTKEPVKKEPTKKEPVKTVEPKKYDPTKKVEYKKGGTVIDKMGISKAEPEKVQPSTQQNISKNVPKPIMARREK